LVLYSIKPIDAKMQIKLRRQMHSLSLQHGEVGLAVDMPYEEPMPKFPLLDILPSNMRKRMYETKPHLFEPTREWIIRLRLEGCQFLLAFQTEEVMLEWVEDLCAAIDISQPIDERTYPRYRSLPRRSRRQRQLENSFRTDFPMVGLESLGERLVQQQQRIINSLYPNLANEGDENTNNVAGTQRQNGHDLEQVTSQDPDMDDLDPADVRESPYLHSEQQNERRDSGESNQRNYSQTFNPKLYSQNLTVCPTAAIRYRRRCAPIMNKYSPRSSDIIFVRGKRMRIDHKRERLVSFEIAPPRYPRANNNKATANKQQRTITITTTNNNNTTTTTRTVSSVFAGEPFLTSRSWRPLPELPTATHADEDACERITSRASTQPSSEGCDDVASVHSAAGSSGDAGSGDDGGIEPVSSADGSASSTLLELTQQSSQESGVDDDDDDGVITGGGGNDGVLAPFKEKTGGAQIVRRRRLSRADEDTVHAFAGLVL
jgi:hypothetical protein